MRCERCERASVWPHDESQWSAVSDGTAVIPLLECTHCGHHQHAR